MHHFEKTSTLKPQQQFRWMLTGDQALGEMLEAISCAQRSVRLEMYIFHESPIALKFRDALVAASSRGVHVQVLVDALGSIPLPESFWDPLRKVGGEFRWFNPLNLRRLGVRDHRKLLVCDEQVAFVGGFNISSEYQGNGVDSGWRDVGLKICGPLSLELAKAFDDMFRLADFRRGRFARLRGLLHQQIVWSPDCSLLLGAPGRTRNVMKHAIQSDFSRAKNIQIICAYFLPTWRIRRLLSDAARRGAKVQLILPAKTDVPLMRLASQSLYRRLLRAGVEIYEYQPQILHAKLIVVDEAVVYAGSANLDIRSLHMNYELLVRVENKDVAAEASTIFESALQHCRRIELKEWIKSRTTWAKIKGRVAYFVLARLDPFIGARQVKQLAAR